MMHVHYLSRYLTHLLHSASLARRHTLTATSFTVTKLCLIGPCNDGSLLPRSLDCDS